MKTKRSAPITHLVIEGTGKRRKMMGDITAGSDSSADRWYVSNDDIPIEAGRILTNAMYGVTYNDRNAIYEEIHGVRCLAKPETPASLLNALHEFEKVLQKESCRISNKNLYSSYNAIMSKREKLRDELLRNPNNNAPGLGKKISYCQSHYAIDIPAFRLRFLRAELFDIRKAVVRYCNYLNLAHELWGSVALDREINLSDLDRSETAFFRKGYFQLLPFRDQSGRRVVTHLGGMGMDVDKIARVSC